MESAFYQATKKKKRKTVPLNRRIRVLKYYNYTCQLCQRDLHECEPGERIIDHKIPVSKGGDNSFANLWVLCYKCDNKKGNKYIREAIDSYIKIRRQQKKKTDLPPHIPKDILSFKTPDTPKPYLKLGRNRIAIPEYIRCIDDSGKDNYCTKGEIYFTGDIRYSAVSFERMLRKHPEQFVEISKELYEALKRINQS